jgi:hypothetical protein
MAYPMFNVFSVLFMLFAAVKVLMVDRRRVDRMVITCSLIAQAGAIAVHHSTDAGNVAIPLMLIDGALLYIVMNSGLKYRNAYGLLIFAAISLTFLWLLDSAAGTGFLYVNDEPSVYTTLCAIMTIMQGVIFFGIAEEDRGDTARHRHLRSDRLYADKEAK